MKFCRYLEEMEKTELAFTNKKNDFLEKNIFWKKSIKYAPKNVIFFFMYIADVNVIRVKLIF